MGQTKITAPEILGKMKTHFKLDSYFCVWRVCEGILTLPVVKRLIPEEIWLRRPGHEDLSKITVLSSAFGFAYG